MQLNFSEKHGSIYNVMGKTKLTSLLLRNFIEQDEAVILGKKSHAANKIIQQIVSDLIACL